MKSSSLAILLMVSILFGCADKSSHETEHKAPAPVSGPVARSGGTDVGDGGKSRPSNFQEIRNSVADLKTQLEQALGRIRKHSGLIKDARVKKILERMFSSDAQILKKDMAESKYILDADETCPHIEPDDRDASTVRGQLGAAVCFHVEEIKRLPVESLPVQLVAIAAHEHAHHFGFDEAEAKHLQDFMLEQGKWLVRPNKFYTEYADPTYQMVQTATELMNQLDQMPEDGICKKLNNIEISEIRMDAFLFEHPEFSENSKVPVRGANLAANKLAYLTALSLMSYCGSDSNDTFFALAYSLAIKKYPSLPAPQAVKVNDKGDLKIKLQDFKTRTADAYGLISL